MEKKEIAEVDKGIYSPLYFFLIAMVSLFVSEAVVMLIIKMFFSNLPSLAKGYFGFVILTVFFIPNLYLFIYRPMAKYKRLLEKKLHARTKLIEKYNLNLKTEYDESLSLFDEKFRSVIDNLGVGVTIINPEMRIININRQMQRWYPGVNLASRPKCYQVFNSPDQKGICDNCPVYKALSTGKVCSVTKEIIINAEPVVYRIIASPIKDSNGNVVAVSELVEDVTKYRQAELKIRDLNRDLESKIEEKTKALRNANKKLGDYVIELEKAKDNVTQSRDFYFSLFDNFPALIWRSGVDGQCDYVNQTWLKYVGRNIDDEVGFGWTQSIHAEDKENLLNTYLSAFEKRDIINAQYRVKRNDGQYRWVTDNGIPYYDIEGNFAGYVGFCHDIDKLKQTKEELRESKERYMALIKQSSEGIFVFDLFNRRIQECNAEFASMLGYTEAEICSLKYEDFCIANITSIEENISRSINSGHPIYVVRQYLRKDGKKIDVELNISIINFINSKVCLINVRDITERLKSDKALQDSLISLKKTLEETVKSLMLVAEKRDPYTAGHQHRVANLATNIAEEMELSERQVEGIYTAGLLHDIGKIYVPADILNKPGRLTDMEMGIIRAHPQVSQEIICNIPFEAPVAEIVLQHHERLDGSGYPNGLSEEEIMIEAKILAVADVVEAMASHRPYRPAIGLKKALEEIEENSDKLYDPKVVDACLNLFRNKNYELDNENKQGVA